MINGKKKKTKQKILSAGSNTFGCLCHPWEDNSTLPSSIIGLHRSSIISFSTGSFHGAAVNDDGSVFGWGYNEDGQIGFPIKNENELKEIQQTKSFDSDDDCENHDLQVYVKPTQIHGCLDSIQVEKVKCGLDFTLFLSNIGEVYIASKKNGDNSIEKVVFPSSSTKCINIFGNYIPWVLCEDGSIYRIFKYAKNNAKFQLMNDFNNNGDQSDQVKDIVSIREGSVLLITEKGRLFGLGSIVRESTHFIELDLEKNMPRSENDQSHFVKVKQIAGISSHFVILTENGEIYVWGKNDNGQLGIGNKIDQKNPFTFIKVPPFSKYKIVFIAAGSKFSIFVAENGDLWATGCGKDGQTMLGDEHERIKPEKSLVVHNVTSVFCGDSFTFVFIY